MLKIVANYRPVSVLKWISSDYIITFIDFKKAFDTIHRGKMLKLLKACGIPAQLVNAKARMYEGTK